jgi:hypothetical protein
MLRYDSTPSPSPSPSPPNPHCDPNQAVWNLWVALAFMWGWAAALLIIGLPIYENRKTFAAVLTCNTSAGGGAKKTTEVGKSSA